MPPANDNAPRREADFIDLAARRAWLASLPTTYKPVLAWPTAERLARQNKRLAAVLVRYRDITQPTKHVAANDNDPHADGIREFRPSLGELAAAIDTDLVVDFPSRAEANAGWSMRLVDGHMVCFQGEHTHLGGMTFLRGALQSFGRYTGRDGKVRTKQPRELWRHPKGSKPKPRSTDAIRFLVANDNVPVAKRALFLAGAVGNKGTTSTENAQHLVEAEMARGERARAARDALGADAWLVDMALTDATAAEIGMAMGFEGKRAERRAIRAIDAALEKIEKLVA